MIQESDSSANLGKLIVKGSISFSTTGIIQQVLLFIQGMITYRILSVGERGIYAQVWSIFSFVGTFTFVNMVQQIVIKKVSENLDNKPKINQVLSGFLLYSIISSTVFVLFFVIIYLFERWNIVQIFDDGLAFPLMLASVSIYFAISGYSIVFVGIKEYFNYTFIQVLATAIHFVFCVGFLLIFHFYTELPPYYGIFIGLILKTVVVQFLTTVMVRRKYGKFMVKIRDLKGFGTLITESFGLGVEFILYSILIDGSIIVMAYFAANSETVAFYELIRNTGMNISRIIGLLLGTMLLSIIPNYLKKYNYDTVEKITGYVSKAILYILSIIMLGVVILPEIFIKVFTLNANEYLVVQNLLFVSCFLILYTVLLVAIRPILISQKKIRTLIFIDVVRTIVFLSLSFILLPKLGNKLNGMLLIISITYTINIVIAIYYTQKSGKVYFFKYYRKLFALTLCFLGVSTIGMFFIQNSVIFLWKIPIFIVVIILYHIFIISFGAITKQDVIILEGIAHSFVKEDSLTGFKWKKQINSIITWLFKILYFIPFRQSEIKLREYQLKNNICIISEYLELEYDFEQLLQQGYRITIITKPNQNKIIHYFTEEGLEIFHTFGVKSFPAEAGEIFQGLYEQKQYKYLISFDLAANEIIKDSRFKSDFIIVINHYWRDRIKKKRTSNKIQEKLHALYLFFYYNIRRFSYYDTLTRSQYIITNTIEMKNTISKDIKSESEKIVIKKNLDFTELIKNIEAN